MNKQRFIILVLLVSLAIVSTLGIVRTSAASPLAPALNQVEGVGVPAEHSNNAVTPSTSSGQALPAGVSADWRAGLREEIGESEYRAIWQEKTRINAPTQLVGFSAANYSVGEAESTATITVTLDAALSLTVTVDYATSDNTAIAGSDYLTVSGVLTFTPDVTSQIFTVSILDDTLEESDETITLTLSNPTNGALRIPESATLTILDDDNYIYLPLVLKRWPPIPYTPVLNSISNPDSDGNYTVNWDSAELAESYTLEEATNANFTDATVVYQGTGTLYTVSDQSAGTYYYRVKATNGWGDSGWSNVQLVTVAPPPPMTLYLHVRDESPKYFLNTTRQDGTDFNTSVGDSKEWLMTLEKDLVGTEYAYAIYINIGTYQGAITCDIEILLRRDSTDTLLTSWPQAFTVPPGNNISLFTGTATGVDPNAQAGDTLVLRIRPHNGYVLVWTGNFYGQSVYSYIEVPGYAP
jgi:hypothetical protein